MIKKHFARLIVGLFITVLLVNSGSGCIASASIDRAKSKGHSCKWDKCPYKGIYPHWYAKAVKEYTGKDRKSDAFWLDYLHLVRPWEDYEQLEARLIHLKRK